jgi:hypothetical protein
MINAEGGVNGRKIKIVSPDDGYLPPKSVEVTRQLVEQENVLLMPAARDRPTRLCTSTSIRRRCLSSSLGCGQMG